MAKKAFPSRGGKVTKGQKKSAKGFKQSKAGKSVVAKAMRGSQKQISKLSGVSQG